MSKTWKLAKDAADRDEARIGRVTDSVEPAISHDA